MSIQEIFSEYQKNGLLVRTEDGNTHNFNCIIIYLHNKRKYISVCIFTISKNITID